MVTRKKQKIATFSIFSFSKCHILVCNQVNISLGCQIENLTMPYPIRTFGIYFI